MGIPSSPPNTIKHLHRKAKQKQIRRRRSDFPCGCSVFISIDCRGHGFTHRGTNLCTSSETWRLYLEHPEPPIFQGCRTHPATIQQPPRHHHSPNPVQPQLEEGTGSTQVLDTLEDLDDGWI
ncbi:transcriptional activator protein [Camellia oleifera geminivirus]|nr:transcriptional activator protein [Camellia oleifera geminivirus]